jgi:hypothetical protein
MQNYGCGVILIYKRHDSLKIFDSIVFYSPSNKLIIKKNLLNFECFHLPIIESPSRKISRLKPLAISVPPKRPTPHSPPFLSPRTFKPKSAFATTPNYQSSRPTKPSIKHSSSIRPIITLRGILLHKFKNLDC